MKHNYMLKIILKSHYFDLILTRFVIARKATRVTRFNQSSGNQIHSKLSHTGWFSRAL